VQNRLENTLSCNHLLSHLQGWHLTALVSDYILYQSSLSPFFKIHQIGYQCLSEMVKMAKIDFQMTKFVSIEDVQKCVQV
jgi:hypothetical protein